MPQKQAKNRNPDGTFPPGVSGNPGGRPRGRVSLRALLQERLAQVAPPDPFDFGAPDARTWAERIVDRMLDAATHGDARALRLVWEYVEGRPAEEVRAVGLFLSTELRSLSAEEVRAEIAELVEQVVDADNTGNRLLELMRARPNLQPVVTWALPPGDETA
jgi:hypothetical protein